MTAYLIYYQEGDRGQHIELPVAPAVGDYIEVSKRIYVVAKRLFHAMRDDVVLYVHETGAIDLSSRG